MITASYNWLRRAKAGGRPIVQFAIDGYSRVFSTAPTGAFGCFPEASEGNLGQLAQRAQDLEGGSSTSDVSFTVVDSNRRLTQDFQQGASLQGKKCVVSVGFAGLDAADYLTLANMKVDHIDLASQNTAYRFTLRDDSLLLQQFAFPTGDNGYPTGKNSPATVEGNPMDILQAAAEDSGLSAAQLNAAAIADIKSNVCFGLDFYFSVTYPPRAKEFIENEIMKPLGMYWFWNSQGLLTPVSMLPWSTPSPVMTLDESIISLSAPPVPVRSDKYFSTFLYKMDADSNGQNCQTAIAGAYTPAVNQYGISGSDVLISRGVRSALGGARIAHLMMQTVFRRYGLKPFTLRARCLLPAWQLELGDRVRLDHSMIPNGMWPSQFRSSGLTGLTGTLWEVLGKTVDLNQGVAVLDLLDVSWMIQQGAWQFAPDGTGTYPGNKSTSYMFIAGSGSQYSDGDAARQIY